MGFILEKFLLSRLWAKSDSDILWSQRQKGIHLVGPSLGLWHDSQLAAVLDSPRGHLVMWGEL